MSNHHPFTAPFSPSLALAISPSDILDFHRSTFGDCRMEDDGGNKGGDGGTGSDKPDPADKDKGGDSDKDKPLGPNGEKALNAERDARQKAEREAKQSREKVDSILAAFKNALGIEDDKGSDADDVAARLQERIDSLERGNLVERIARHHKITEDADIEFLKSAKDEEAMTALARRLAPSGGDAGDDNGNGPARNNPRPDPNQGKRGDSGARATSVAQVMADRRAAREKAKQ